MCSRSQASDRSLPADTPAAGAWDMLAARYRRQERLEARAIDVALRLAAPAPGERVVDLATGTGLLLRRLAALPARPDVAVGIDRSAGMLQRVGALPAGWSTVQADARDVPLPDDWADVVTCSYLLHLLDGSERRNVLSEARRLLKPRATSRLAIVTVWADDRGARGRMLSRALRLAVRSRPTAWAGLQPLDGSFDTQAAGFDILRRVVVPRGGYPSLVVLAQPLA